VAALLAIYAALALVASTGKGVSFDEAEQIAVGYDIWVRHDFRMETANGDLVKRWATLPLLISRPALPSTNDLRWRQGEPYVVGYEFFFQCGNRPESLLLQCRAMMVLMGAATGLLVFLCSRRIFGLVGGFVSLAIFAFSPHMLAFGSLVATTMSVCLTLLALTCCIWQLLHRVTWGRLLGSLVFCGLLVLAKLSALVILPIAVVLTAVKLVSGRALEWRLGRPRVIQSRWVQAGIFSGLVLVHAIAGWGFIWAQYDFRYVASPDPSDPGIVTRVRPYSDPIDPTAAAVLAWARRTHFMPEGYLHGIGWLLGSNDTRQAYMNGRWTSGGWPMFFPYTLWVKTSPYLLVLLLLGCGGWWWRWRAGRRKPGRDVEAGATALAPSLYETTPFVVLIVVYLGVALVQDLNIGHRHILPIYPAIYVLAGSAACLWSLRVRWPKVLIALLLLGKAVDAAVVYPHYLAYFSPLVGGSSQGYQYLVDSSLDWGMDLPGLKHWLDEHNPGSREAVFLAYFGTDSPDYYGIKCKRLPGFFDWRTRDVFPLAPGIYAISATLLQSTYTDTFGPWNSGYEQRYQSTLHNLQTLERTAKDPQERETLLKKHPPAFWDHQYDAFEKLRFGRLCAWLRHHGAPDDNVGHSILIWRLDAAHLRDALFGPPAELDDDAVPRR
jgi:4-amino-4-deoxy-L-arabinose transferase-like glycosyltransferase